MYPKLVRLCPKCHSERPATETSCEGEWNGQPCDWNLLDLPLAIGGASADASRPGVESKAVETKLPSLSVGETYCLNNHVLEPGDLICLTCGGCAAPAPTSNKKASPKTGQRKSKSPGKTTGENSIPDSSLSAGQTQSQSADKRADESAAANSDPSTRANSDRNSHANSAQDTLANTDQPSQLLGENSNPNANEDISAAETEERTIGEWRVLSCLPARSRKSTRFRVERQDGSSSTPHVLVLFNAGVVPERSIYQMLGKMPEHSVAILVDQGTESNCAYEVWHEWTERTLEDLISSHSSEISLRDCAEKLGLVLSDLATSGLRHRDLRPANIQVRSEQPLQFSLSGFTSTLLAEFDLEIVSPTDTTRYTAPETLGGGISAASDWWSLGMILLEIASKGKCFEGVNENAFLIHVVTTGVALPTELDIPTTALLRGLLNRNPHKRWQWREVKKWLEGEFEELSDDSERNIETDDGAKIVLAGKSYRRPESFALAAAELQNWNEATALLIRGALCTWLEDSNANPNTVAAVRNILADSALTDDLKLAFVLICLNSNMPFSIHGEIVNPGWLLANIELGTNLIDPSVAKRIRQMERESWLQKLSERAESVRKRISEYDLLIDDQKLNAALLCTSKRNLEAELVRKRAMFPDSEHELILSLLERKNLSEEDLIILLSATPSNFILASQVLDKSAKLASQIKGLKFERDAATAFLSLSRRQLYDEIDKRIAGFSRCGIEVIDNWADTYRLERRLPLERCLVLLAVSTELWKEPLKQQYITEILKFGERRIMATINQGPLVFLRTSKSSSSIDLRELGSHRQSAEKLLDQLLARTSQLIDIDPEVFETTPNLERRIRGLVQKTTIFRRDTSKHGLFLGFPFVVLRTKASDDTKTKIRVAPILLFPVRIDAQIGTRGRVGLAGSPDSDEVRLNPALAGILNLAPKEEEKWQDALKEILERSHITQRDIIDVFRQLCATNDISLQNIPARDVECELDKSFLSYSAALFHCDFAGKAVADDLRNICGRPISGTALELALRVKTDDDTDDNDDGSETVTNAANSSPSNQTQSSGLDISDHSVIAADPSQERAVQQSRLAKGLHIEGPPGTGKSQTIVNIIADCVARNETALVICQKQAALSVVEKRLKAEGLGRRLFYITDISKDRQSVIRALREQLDERAAGQGAPVAQLRKERAGLMSRCLTIDSELNKHHSAVHDVFEEIGLSYRKILAELIKLESSETEILNVPRLRTIMKDLDDTSASALTEECSSIASLWFDAKYEDSPLQDLKLFSPDNADAILIKDEFRRFEEAEQHRFQTLSEYPRSNDVDDISIYVNWLKENEDYIRGIPKDVRVNLSKWVGNFFPDAFNNKSAGTEAISSLVQISDLLSRLDKNDHNPAVFPALANLKTDVLKQKIAMAISATSTGGFFTKINPVRALNRYQLKTYLKSLGQPFDDRSMLILLRAATLEQDLRPSRKVVEQISKTLRLEPADAPLDLARLQNSVSVLMSQLSPVAELSSKLRACPLPNDAKDFAKTTEPEAFDEFSSLLKGVIKRHAVKTESLNKLNRLSDWFEEEWMQAQKKVISSARGNIEAVRHLQRALPTVVAYQEFRLRARTLNAKSLEIFVALREREAELQLHPKHELASVLRSAIRRETCLAWKSQLETKEPALTIPKDEITYKVKSLSDSDDLLRRLNRQILSEPTPESNIAGGKKWEGVTRLMGARAKRLRELISEGTDLGLMKLRPVWLMNPETASRLLPLTSGLFDVVIFDEASQLLVEYALPTLFRAKRAIVSGDEKQMPPPTFFSARVQNDEALDLDEDELDELLPQAERDRIEDTWNRREIKDCPDLLNLASTVLPSRSLQIHYRSEFRELIAFSNSAFYSDTLSVPIKRPASEIKKARPIEVIAVNTPYEKQTNRGEALKVAEILQKIWSVPADQRPTVGVVSFNLKQSGLIEEVLEDMALKNQEFKAAFELESTRTKDGEDVGFFVKNLENVQGDERDIIIFSTTFGKDSHGVFRRNFGKLGQIGGERRLNVAITRAKRKVILITSLPVEKISDFLGRGGSPTIPRDYVQAYMDYAVKISNGSLDAADTSLTRLSGVHNQRVSANTQSQDPFIADVAKFIRSLGHEPVTQQKDENNAFNIDIAIENPNTGLFGIGIECDAPRHKILSSAKHREIWRPSVLSKSIAKIHRINSRDWYQKRDREKELLREAINEALSPGEAQ